MQNTVKSSWDASLPIISPDISKAGRYFPHSRVLQTREKYMGKCICMNNCIQEISKTWRYFPHIQGCLRPGKMHIGKCSRINNCVWCVWRIQEQHWLWQSIWRMHTAGSSSNCWWACSYNMELAWQSPIGLLQRSRKISGLAAWEVELYSSSADNGFAPRLVALASPLQCVHQGYGRSEPTWTQPGTRASRWWAHIYKTTKDTQEAALAVQQQLQKTSHWCKHRITHQSKQDTHCGAFWQQSVRKSNASS